MGKPNLKGLQEVLRAMDQKAASGDAMDSSGAKKQVQPQAPLAEGKATEPRAETPPHPDSRTVSGAFETRPRSAPAAREPSAPRDMPGLEGNLSPGQVIEKIKLHAIGGVALLPYGGGFVFCGESAASELAERATLEEFQSICSENYKTWSADPQNIYVETHGADMVVCMATSMREGQPDGKSLPVLVIFVMPVRLKENLQAALLDEPGFANTFLREMSPLFTAHGPRASDPAVRDAIFLKSDFSGMLLVW